MGCEWSSGHGWRTDLGGGLFGSNVESGDMWMW